MVSLTPASPRHILIVDDDPTALLVLDSYLNRMGFEAISAKSVKEAVAKLSERSCDTIAAVITDYWMPGGTGLDLLRILRMQDPALAVIIQTAEGDKEIVTGALSAGAFGYLDKPIGPGLLADLVNRAVAATQQQRKLQETARAAQEIGRNQIQLLLHQAEKMGDRIQLYYQPLDSVSGDFVSIFPIDESNYVILASDTSGHDMKSAFQSSYFHGLARGMLRQAGTIEEVFRFSNQMLLEGLNKNGVEISLSAIAISANLRTRNFQTLNAGIPCPYLVDGEGMANPLDDGPSNPLGWFENLPPSQAHSQPEGHVVFWTDGLDDLADRLQIDPLSIACRLCRSEEDKSKLTMQAHDDVIVVRATLGQETSVAHQPFALLSRTYRGDQINEINSVQSYCENSIRTALPELAEDQITDVLICLREALINALKHGCQASPDQSAKVQAAYHFTTRTLRLRISDTGPGHDFDHDTHEAKAADELLTEHRGLVMIKHLPTQTNFSARGSIVTMDFTF